MGQKERQTEAEMQLRKKEILPQKNKSICYNQSFPQVFPKKFYKYSITSFPDRHAWDVQYETLRVGLRGIRDSLEEQPISANVCI